MFGVKGEVCSVVIRCTVHSAAHIAQGQTKSNFSMIKKNVEKTKGSAAVFYDEKGFRSDKKVENHCS